MAKRPADSVDITRGSKNVFEDLGYPDATERQAKLRLAYALNQVLEQQALTLSAGSDPAVAAARESAWLRCRGLGWSAHVDQGVRSITTSCPSADSAAT